MNHASIKRHGAYPLLISQAFCDKIRLNYINDLENPNNDPYSSLPKLEKLLKVEKHKIYYVSQTATEHLELLKIKKPVWNAFGEMPDGKRSYILPGNELLRIEKIDNRISIWWLMMKEEKNHMVNYYCDYWWVDTKLGAVAYGNAAEKIEPELNVFKLLCFIELSERKEEVVIPAGSKYGTRKGGKLINDLPFKVIMVNTKWNVTIHRQGEFLVRPHFALRWIGKGRTSAKLVFIEQFVKHGYTRTYSAA